MRVDRNRGEWVLKLNKSLLVINQASANRSDLIKTDLERRYYHQYKVDPFVFYRKKSVILTDVDDCVIVSHKKETIVQSVESLNNGKENNVLTDEGDISDHIGVNNNKNKMGH